MRILHTADWHLANRLAGLPRLGDQLALIDRILGLCDEHAVDVLVVAGDIFDTADPDRVREVLLELGERLRPRLANGLSAIFLPGNHDRESLFPILESAQYLAGTPIRGAARVFFRSKPTIVARADRAGNTVQFLLLPYTRASAYLNGDAEVASTSEAHAHLAQAWRDELQRLGVEARNHPDQPVVVVSHILVRDSSIGSAYRLAE